MKQLCQLKMFITLITYMFKQVKIMRSKQLTIAQGFYYMLIKNCDECMNILHEGTYLPECIKHEFGQLWAEIAEYTRETYNLTIDIDNMTLDEDLGLLISYTCSVSFIRQQIKDINDHNLIAEYKIFHDYLDEGLREAFESEETNELMTMYDLLKEHYPNVANEINVEYKET